MSDEIDRLRRRALTSIMAAAYGHHDSAATSGPVLLAAGLLAQAAITEDALFDEEQFMSRLKELEDLASG